ncbi:MAG: hypothetical protein P4L84_12590 [Isosphaeraceae bacterium]|nr:hypothetical protein [Isosphaeraceae bacterium]
MKLRYIVLAVLLLAATGVVLIGVAGGTLMIGLLSAGLAGIGEAFTVLIYAYYAVAIALLAVYYWQMLWAVALPRLIVHLLESGSLSWDALWFPFAQ